MDGHERRRRRLDWRLVTADTAFALASVSKTFTAAVALQLIEEGKIGLDDPVAKWLPGLKLDRRISVRMLDQHQRPGRLLPRPAHRPLQGTPDAAWTLPRTLRYVRKPVAKPGQAFYYSNTNYLLLGEVIQRVTGMPLATLVRDRLLEPLGLHETCTRRSRSRWP